MADINFIDDFPRSSGETLCSWTPVQISPILGSDERLTIGVIAISETDFYLAKATEWERLNCLYGERSAPVIFAAKTSLDALEEDIAKRHWKAIIEPSVLFSSVSIGDLHEGSGRSLEEIANYWLQAASSLATRKKTLVEDIEEAAFEASDEYRATNIHYDVFDLVSRRNSQVSHFFAEHIQAGKRRPASRKKDDQVLVDFRGRILVANFGTLTTHGPSNNERVFKSLLWDLKIDRDRPTTLDYKQLKHELIIHIPEENDPNFSEQQRENMHVTLGRLEVEADQEELRLRQMHSAKEIAEHIIEVEAA